APTPDNDPYPRGSHTEGNQNLHLGAGIRLVGAAASSIEKSNITDNAFGVINTAPDGTTASSTPVQAKNNWWGLRTGTVTLPTTRTSPATTRSSARRSAVVSPATACPERRPRRRRPRS